MFSSNHEVDVIVRQLDDEVMLKMMAAENMQEWQSDASVTQETVRACVQAYAQGLIRLPDVSPDDNHRSVRFAPSFVPGRTREGDERFPFNAETLSCFLGFKKSTTEIILDSLAAIERGSTREVDYKGISERAGRYLTAGVRTLEVAATKGLKRATSEGDKNAEQKIKADLRSAKREFKKQIKANGSGAAPVARRLVRSLNLENLEAPDVNDGARRLWNELSSRFLGTAGGESVFSRHLTEIVSYAEYLEPKNKDTLVNVLEEVATKFNMNARLLKKSRFKPVKQAQVGGANR